MDELFGASVVSIAQVLGVIFALFTAVLIFITIRHLILVRMAVRQVLRRPARSLIIIVGLMLATGIITSAFTTGDSITFSIKKSVTENLRTMDELIRIDQDSGKWKGKPVPDHFSETTYELISDDLDTDPDLDGVLPALVEMVAVVNERSQQFEVNALLSGLDPLRASKFDQLFDQDGRPVSLSSLGPDEVYIDSEGALKVDAVPGDVLGVALSGGNLTPMKVKAVIDGWYFKTGESELVIAIPLDRAQRLLGLEGQLSGVLLSNRGDGLNGVEHSDSVVKRIGALPAITDNGLEVFDIKREAIDLANSLGNLFVSFFTVFGLFSIGVGLLLIFLIFSMLAAERKGELGMARAVGMQRRHLVRMFLAEGAIYGLGSSLVGVVVGVGLGYVLVLATSGAFGQDPTEDFDLSPHVEITSVLVSFFIGIVITLVTVAFASWRISRLNIVRAIRDIPEPRLVRAGKSTLFLGCLLSGIGLLMLLFGMKSSHLTLFGLGVSLIPMGIAMVLRWKGVGQRWVLTGTGLILVIWWLMPPMFFEAIKDDWNQDFSIFFVTGALLVTGGVLVLMNNANLVLGVASKTLGQIQMLAPVVKASVAYPLRFGFRTGLSVAMFAVVIFSVTVMSIIIEGFNQLLEDEARLGGGYQVIGRTSNDLNPIRNLSQSIENEPELTFIARRANKPSVGTLRSIPQADARLKSGGDLDFRNTTITGVDDDFVGTNQFEINMATTDYIDDSGLSNEKIWMDIKNNPGLAVVNAFLVPSRNNFEFELDRDEFKLDEVEGLYRENKTMDPVEVVVRDLKSDTTFQLTIVGVLDDFASQGILPPGIFTSTRQLELQVPREIVSTQFFFHVESGTENAANKIEAVFFNHGLETIDVQETIDGIQGANRSFFDLLIAFMSLGLVVGIAALGVVSARAVVERRHQIGVMRSIGYSRRMVQASFLLESSFIALLGISMGLVLGLLTAVNVITDIRTNQPDIQFIIPWGRVIMIVGGAYLLSILATFVPARKAGLIAPAEALRYE